MSTRLKTSAIVFGVLLLLCGYFYFQVDWEVRAIRKQLKQVAELVEKEGSVSTFESLARSRQLSNCFTEYAKVEYLAGRAFAGGPDELGRAFLAVWNQVDSASIAILRHEVELSEHHPEAKSRVTVNARVILAGNDAMRDSVQYQIYWRKLDGDWLIHEVVTVGAP